MISFTNYQDENLIYFKNEYTYIWPYNLPLDAKFLNILETEQAKTLEFKPSFNYDISYLPSCIKRIIFPVNSDFNQPLTNLPIELEELELYDKFNQPLYSLPHGLKRLIINGDFNHPLDNLPSTLEYLEIRGEFNYPLDNLPSNLKILVIKEVYDYDDYDLKSCILRSYNKSQSKFNQPINRLPNKYVQIKITTKLYQ
jgi:hypothetical protein